MSQTINLEDDIEEILCDAFDGPSRNDGSIDDFSFDEIHLPTATQVDDAESILFPTSNNSSGLQEAAKKTNYDESPGPAGDVLTRPDLPHAFEPLSPVSLVSEGKQSFQSPCQAKFCFTALDRSLESTIPVANDFPPVVPQRSERQPFDPSSDPCEDYLLNFVASRPHLYHKFVNSFLAGEFQSLVKSLSSPEEGQPTVAPPSGPNAENVQPALPRSAVPVHQREKAFVDARVQTVALPQVRDELVKEIDVGASTVSRNANAPAGAYDQFQVVPFHPLVSRQALNTAAGSRSFRVPADPLPQSPADQIEPRTNSKAIRAKFQESKSKVAPYSIPGQCSNEVAGETSPTTIGSATMGPKPLSTGPHDRTDANSESITSKRLLPRPKPIIILPPSTLPLVCPNLMLVNYQPSNSNALFPFAVNMKVRQEELKTYKGTVGPWKILAGRMGARFTAVQRIRPPISITLTIFLALKNSRHGVLPAIEIYKWTMFNFPFFLSDCLESKSNVRSGIKHKIGLEFERVYHPKKRNCYLVIIPERKHAGTHKRLCLSLTPAWKKSELASSLRYFDSLDEILSPVEKLRFYGEEPDPTLLQSLLKDLFAENTTPATWWDLSKRYNDIDPDSPPSRGPPSGVRLVPIEGGDAVGAAATAAPGRANVVAFESVATQTRVVSSPESDLPVGSPEEVVDVITIEDSPEETECSRGAHSAIESIESATEAVGSPSSRVDLVPPIDVLRGGDRGDLSRDTTPDLIIHLTGSKAASAASSDQSSSSVPSHSSNKSVESLPHWSPDDLTLEPSEIDSSLPSRNDSSAIPVLSSIDEELSRFLDEIAS